MEIGHRWPHLRQLLSRFSVRLPRFCCFCHQKTNTAYDLCQFCRAHLPSISQCSDQKGPSTLCLRCGFNWCDNEYRQLCAHCVNHQTCIQCIICPYRYDFPIDGLIHRLKYQEKLYAGRLMGSLLAQEVRNRINIDQLPDCLLPVPLGEARYRARGFNHAAEIARWCGRELGIESLPDATLRRFDTESLVGLSRAERGLRIRGAFGCEESLSGRRVAIVDDVLTTGATAGELSTELLDSGVEDVQLWVLARTPAKLHEVKTG